MFSSPQPFQDGGPPQHLFQYANILLVLESPKLDAVLQMNLLGPVGYALANTAQDAFRLLCCEGTLLLCVQIVFCYDLQILFCRAAFYTVRP